MPWVRRRHKPSRFHKVRRLIRQLSTSAPSRICLGLALIAAAFAAEAVIRNATGVTVFGLHVQFSKPVDSRPGTLGPTSTEFTNGLLSGDRESVDFSFPLDPAGIVNGIDVAVNWSDIDLADPATVVSFFWTDRGGNMVGEVQAYNGSIAAPLELGGGSPPLSGPNTPSGHTNEEASPTPVPEPGPATLLFSGALLLLSGWLVPLFRPDQPRRSS